VLALKILAERNEQAAKAAADAAAGIVAPTKKSTKPKAPPKAASIVKESSVSSRDVTPGYADRIPMSISEQIKSEGRARKAASAIPSSNHGSPGPTSAPKQSSPAPVLVKSEKPPTKKKGTAAPVKRPKPKAKPEGRHYSDSEF
jgi:COMPASS component SPP1